MVHAYSTRIWQQQQVDNGKVSAAAVEHGFHSPEGHSKLIMDGPWMLLWPCILIWPWFQAAIGFGFIHNALCKPLASAALTRFVFKFMSMPFGNAFQGSKAALVCMQVHAWCVCQEACCCPCCGACSGLMCLTQPRLLFLSKHCPPRRIHHTMSSVCMKWLACASYVWLKPCCCQETVLSRERATSSSPGAPNDVPVRGWCRPNGI